MKKFAIAAAAAMMVLSSGSAYAAQTLITGSSLATFAGSASDSLTLLSLGNPVTVLNTIAATEADEIACLDPALGGCFFSFGSGAGTGNGLNYANANIFTIIYEPDHVTVSDVFGISCQVTNTDGFCTGGTLGFVSRKPGAPGLDISALLGNINNDRIGYEIAGGEATNFGASFYLNPTVFPPTTTAAIFTSRNEEVPEPLTLSLFGSGLAGLAAIRRRGKPA
jgi:hypothetical protein